MWETNRCVLEDLINWRGEIAGLVEGARHRDCPVTVVFDRACGVAALERALAHPDALHDVVIWAEAVQGHECVDIEDAHADLLTRFLLELSTPELFEPVTAEVCRRWLRALRTPG